jgi:hypothetical protein
MLQDPNVEKYVSEALKPLLKRIERLENSLEVLSNTTKKRIVCNHPEVFITPTVDGGSYCGGCGEKFFDEP